MEWGMKASGKITNARHSEILHVRFMDRCHAPRYKFFWTRDGSQIATTVVVHVVVGVVVTVFEKCLRLR